VGLNQARPRDYERGDFMAIREAQKKAVRKYNEKAYDRVELKVTKGKKAELQAHAESKGESLNAFVNRAIDETVERDNTPGADA
jgi:predicted HicB family RNase H-like nuclease